jgi:hypothetical protein
LHLSTDKIGNRPTSGLLAFDETGLSESFELGLCLGGRTIDLFTDILGCICGPAVVLEVRQDLLGGWSKLAF